MRKKVIFMLLIMLCFCMGGCRPVNEEQKFKVRNTSEKLQGNQIMEEMTAALDTRDVERLKAMFSEVALAEFDEWTKSKGVEDDKKTNLDEQIAEVMEFYQGRMISYEGTVSTSRSRHYNVVILELTGNYTLGTDKETYQLRFKYKSIDDKNPREIGFSKWEIVKKGDYEREDFEWKFYDKALGIYWQAYDEENSSWQFYGEGPDVELEED